MAFPTLNGTPAATSATAATTLAVTMPSGIVTGEQIVVAIATSSAATITPSTGAYWTQQEQDLDGFGQADYAVYTRTADGTEGTTRSFTFASSNVAALSFRVGGADTTTPINVVSTTGTGTSGNTVAITCPSVTTTVNGCMILRFGQSVQLTAMSDPGSHTAIGSATTGGGGSTDPWVQAAYQTQTTAGSTGTAAFVGTGGDRPWLAFTIAIAPGASAGTALGYISSARHPGRGPGIARYGLRANPGSTLVTASANVTVALTGVSGAGAVGSVAPSRTVVLTQVAGTGAVGTVAPSRTVALTQAAGSGAVGTVSPSASVTLSQVAATGAVGALAPSTSVALTQVSGTGAVGTVTTGSDVTVALTGVSAAGAVGSVAPANAVPLTQVSGTGAVGTVATARTVSITGVAAAGAVGTVAPSTAIALTGVSGAGAVGSVAVFSADVTVALTGVQAAGAVGAVSAFGGESATGGTNGPLPDFANKRKRKHRDDIGAPIVEALAKVVADNEPPQQTTKRPPKFDDLSMGALAAAKARDEAKRIAIAEEDDDDDEAALLLLI